MTEFSFWVNYYFNTKKWHTSTLNQNVKLDWNILSVVCRHHDWQLWCKGIISFPFFSSGAQNIFRILGCCWNVSHCFVPLFLSVSPQALIFAMFFIFICLFPLLLSEDDTCWPACMLWFNFTPAPSIFLARSGKSCFRSPPGGIKFSRIPSCHKRFCVLLKLNEVQVCWEAYLPRNGGWVMVV